jgi:hypothetical protein
VSGPSCAFLVLLAGCAGPFVLLTVERLAARRPARLDPAAVANLRRYVG